MRPAMASVSRRLASPCCEPGCWRISVKDARCELHQRALTPLQRRPRTAPRNPLYDSPAWRSLRTKVLLSAPHCRICGQGADVVDHIDGNADNNELYNLQPLCVRCHNRKTFLGGWARRKRER